jgi:hypothetical protein
VHDALGAAMERLLLEVADHIGTLGGLDLGFCMKPTMSWVA